MPTILRFSIVALSCAALLLPLSAAATTTGSERLPETVVATTRGDGGNGSPVRITISSADDIRAVRRVVAAPQVRGAGSR